jgi:hypothetical protein
MGKLAAASPKPQRRCHDSRAGREKTSPINAVMGLKCGVFHYNRLHKVHFVQLREFSPSANQLQTLFRLGDPKDLAEM